MRVFAYPRLTAGTTLLAVLLVLTLAAPLFASYPPLEQHLEDTLQTPGGAFLLGTDQLGRDLFARCLFGGRLVLLVALFSTLLACLVGVSLGLFSGYRGGWLDMAVMRVLDGLIVFPELILALVITYALGPSFWTVTTAIAVVNVPQFARVVRGQVLSLREREFVSAAKVAGAQSSRVMLRHLLPNVSEVVVVQVALTGGTAIFTCASLSFLGLGLPAPAPDWGSILHDGYPYLGTNPMFSLAPGLLIFVAMLSFNLIGDGMRDRFDPKVTGRVSRRRRKSSAKPVESAVAATPAAVAADVTEGKRAR